MKILYLITKSNWGGAQKYVYDLALYAQSLEGRDVDVAVGFGGDGLLSERLEKSLIRTIKIKNLERDINFLKEIKVFIDLFRILKKEKPDILHLNSSKIGGIGSLIARLSGVKRIIYTAHGFPFREERSFLQIVLIKLLSYVTIFLSHMTICVSIKDYQDVKDWPFISKKLVVIHNGIDEKDFPNTGDIKYSSSDNMLRIVSIGELHKNKGFIYGLRAINILRQKIDNFKYTILSFGGEMESELRREIDRLELEDMVSLDIDHDRVRNHARELSQYDIYLMPSLKEGLPYVLLEASINQLPIVASNTGGMAEVVVDGFNGYLVPAKDIQSMADSLYRLLIDKEKRFEYGSNSRIRVLEKFTIKDMLSKTFSVYFKALSKK